MARELTKAFPDRRSVVDAVLDVRWDPYGYGYGEREIERIMNLMEKLELIPIGSDDEGKEDERMAWAREVKEREAMKTSGDAQVKAATEGAKQPDPASPASSSQGSGVSAVKGGDSKKQMKRPASWPPLPKMECSPEYLLGFLKWSYGRRNIHVQDSFPNRKNFMRTAQRVVQDPSTFGYSRQEIFRVKALMSKVRKQPPSPPHHPLLPRGVEDDTTTAAASRGGG